MEEKAKRILLILENLYPKTPIPLKHSNSYTLLIAVLLSAQCTDARVNTITPILFTKASTPQEMLKLSIKEIEETIHSCGLAPKKAKAIWELSKILLEKYHGTIPQTFEELESLPGIGHKTASVVMSQAFGYPAFPVDTHIHRLAKRWGLSNGTNVKKTEIDMKNTFEEIYWNKLHLRMIFFGREYCPAKNHKKEKCPICSWASI